MLCVPERGGNRRLGIGALTLWVLLVSGCQLAMDSSAPECCVTPEALDFGAVPLGEYADLSFVVENVGAGTLNGSVSESSSDYSVEAGGGSLGLEAGQTRAVTVRFSPSSRGTRTGAVGLGTERCSDVLCTGIGTGPLCWVDPTALDFGTVPVGSYSERTFSIRNVGEGDLIGSVGEGYPHYSIPGGAGAFDLVFGQVLTVTVRFEPSSVGPKSAAVGTGTTCGNVACEGVGTEGPVCDVEPEHLEFGDVPVGSGLDLSFEIRNAGGGTLVGFVYASCADYSVISGSGEFNLGSGEARSVVVRFTPTSVGDSFCTVGTGTSGCPDVLCDGGGVAGRQ